MAEPSLNLIGKQLLKIQAELTQMRFAADVDRRNADAQYNGLVAEVGIRIGTFEATIEHRLGTFEEMVERRFDEMTARFDRIEELITKA